MTERFQYACAGTLSKVISILKPVEISPGPVGMLPGVLDTWIIIVSTVNSNPFLLLCAIKNRVVVRRRRCLRMGLTNFELQKTNECAE